MKTTESQARRRNLDEMTAISVEFERWQNVPGCSCDLCSCDDDPAAETDY